jgi:hypothetical protein
MTIHMPITVIRSRCINPTSGPGFARTRPARRREQHEPGAVHRSRDVHQAATSITIATPTLIIYAMTARQSKQSLSRAVRCDELPAITGPITLHGGHVGFHAHGRRVPWYVGASPSSSASQPGCALIGQGDESRLTTWKSFRSTGIAKIGKT